MVCFPHAGGAAGYYHALLGNSLAGSGMAAVQYPGRHDRLAEPCPGSVRELAEGVLPELREHAAGRPLVLFGHSMGALVAFEAAHLLREQGLTPAALVVSGQQAPHHPASADAEGVDRLSDEDLVARLVRLGGTAADAFSDPEMLDLVLPATRADFRAAAGYTYTSRPPLPVPVTAIVGDRDSGVSEAGAGSWSTHTTAGFALRVLPGGHFYLAEAANTRQVVEAIRAALPPEPRRAPASAWFRHGAP
ncbi:alpha/beta fold hydrolase [Streptomyces sp. NPDC046805]|uniref:thioesterase II family protein n=1 Tax=Streptomyces sp. NPDC046805 TaxID=3155134 RepID=UPI0033DFF6FE